MNAGRQTFFHGVLPVLTASVLWAFGYFARKTILYDITPFTLTTLTSLIVMVFLTALFRPSPAQLWAVFKSNVICFFGIAVFGVIFGGTLMFVALDHMDLGVANILEKLQPIFTLILAYYTLKERFSRATLVYSVLALFSSWMIAAGDARNLTLAHTDAAGLLAVIGAALSWAAGTIFGKILMNRDLRSRDVTLVRFILASAILLPLFTLQPAPLAHLRLEPQTWLILILSAVVCTGIGYVVYYKGLRYLPASTSNFLELVTPVVSVLLGIAFLDEKLTFLQIIFIPLMLFSVYKISTAKKHYVMEL